MLDKSTTIERLKKAVEVLQSKHVSEVAVTYEYEQDNIRFYTAVTTRSGVNHIYTVRVQDWFEDGEKQVWAKCSCKASGQNLVCRHILKVAAMDTELCSRDLHLDTFCNYKAHLCFAKN